jgi:hypothetical protein
MRFQRTGQFSRHHEALGADPFLKGRKTLRQKPPTARQQQRLQVVELVRIVVDCEFFLHQRGFVEHIPEPFGQPTVGTLDHTVATFGPFAHTAVPCFFAEAAPPAAPLVAIHVAAEDFKTSA